MSKIKLLYGLESVGGGAFKHLIYLVSHIDQNQFDITVILSKKRNESIEDEMFKLKKSCIRVFEMPMKRNISIYDIIVLLKLFINIKREKYDIVHAHSSKAGGLFRIAAWLAKIPVICYTPHCFFFQGKTGCMKKIFIVIEKILASITTSVIVSEKEKDEILKYKIISAQRIFWIDNAINTNDYKEVTDVVSVKSKYGLNSCHSVIGAIGRLAKQKDWVTYVRAAKEVLKTYPEVKFLIVGSGELLPKIKQLIINNKLERSFIFTGYIDSNSIDEVFSLIDIYVNTSKCEGLPYVLLEAMFYEKPIIATFSGGRTIILHEKTGFLVQDGNCQEVANKIIYLIKNRQIAQQMGVAGRKRLYEKYSFEDFIIKHEKMYFQNIVRH